MKLAGEMSDQRVGRIVEELRNILRSEMERHGANPVRHFEMLNAVGLLVGTMLAGSPNADDGRAWLLAIIDDTIAKTKGIK